MSTVLASSRSLNPKSLGADAPDFCSPGAEGEALPAAMKLAILGFVPPQVMDRDQKNLAGKVYVNGVVEPATRYVPETRAQGADVRLAWQPLESRSAQGSAVASRELALACLLNADKAAVAAPVFCAGRHAGGRSGGFHVG